MSAAPSNRSTTLPSLAIKPYKPPAEGESLHARLKWKSMTGFLEQMVTFQNSLGHIVAEIYQPSSYTPSSSVLPERIRLECVTPNGEPACDFNLSVQKTLWLNKKQGREESIFETDPDSFKPQHNHEPYYAPLNIDAENERRLQLQKNNPHLTKDSPECRITMVPKEAFGAFLDTINPQFRVYLPRLKDLGVTEQVTPMEYWSLGPEVVWSTLLEVEHMPMMTKFQILEGLKRAVERREAGRSGPLDGSLGLTDAQDLKTKAWIQNAIKKGEIGMRAKGIDMTA